MHYPQLQETFMKMRLLNYFYPLFGQQLDYFSLECALKVKTLTRTTLIMLIIFFCFLYFFIAGGLSQRFTNLNEQDGLSDDEQADLTAQQTGYGKLSSLKLYHYVICLFLFRIRCLLLFLCLRINDRCSFPYQSRRERVSFEPIFFFFFF